MILKCKMCGGDLNFEAGAAICECEFCGTTQTIPNADNEKKANLFNRANRLRMASEFDKAAAVYESIVAEFPEEAEAYWGLCLCAYGIEYVDDPATGKKLPTCHRTRQTSIMDDSNFDMACEYADSVAHKLYREEAKEIDRLQQEILKIARQETPYDVFICYKETGAEGGRTEDSVLAQDMYDALSAKGLKVFFARITLEDKLGRQYEPYIYAALHSAKVMLAVGTTFEYFDAVWVKNEWSRFLAMMKEDRHKTLIPCYKGIDAYDIPKEFRGLQAQDMGKLGWLQDLTRGVMKLCGKEQPAAVQPAATAVAVQANADAMVAKQRNADVENLLKRAWLYMEDKNKQSAQDCFDKALNMDAENALAYVGLLCIACGVWNQENLVNAAELFTSRPEYKKAERFADPALREKLHAWAKQCEKRLDEAKARQSMEKLLERVRRSWSISECDIIRKDIQSIPNLPQEEMRKGTQCCDDRKNAILREDYQKANKLFGDAKRQADKQQYVNAVAVFRDAEKAFKALGEYRDSKTQHALCLQQIEACEKGIQEAAERERQERERQEAERAERERIEEERRRQQKLIAEREAQERRRKAKKRRNVFLVLLVIAALLAAAYMFVLKPMLAYKHAEQLLEKQDYLAAYSAFVELGDYQDSTDRVLQADAAYSFTKGEYIKVSRIYHEIDVKYHDYADELEALYENAQKLRQNGQLDEALQLMRELGKVDDERAIMYQQADALAAASEYDAAIGLFSTLVTFEYSDSASRVNQAKADKAFAEGNYAQAWSIYAGLDKKYHTHGTDYDAMYAAAVQLRNDADYAGAAAGFAALGTYSDAEEQVKLTKYQQAEALYNSGDWAGAGKMFAALSGYHDSADRKRQTEADVLYAEGSLEDAYAIYAALGEAYQTHADDYAAMYAEAERHYAEGSYEEAIAAFQNVGYYQDAGDRAEMLIREYAGKLEGEGDLIGAEAQYSRLPAAPELQAELNALRQQIITDAMAVSDYEQAAAYVVKLPVTDETKRFMYDLAQKCHDAQAYEIAVNIYGLLGNYELSATRISVSHYAWADQLFSNGDFAQAAEQFKALGKMSDSEARWQESLYHLGGEHMKNGGYDDAKKCFAQIPDYRDVATLVNQCDYLIASGLMAEGELQQALDIFLRLADFSDSVAQVMACRYGLAQRLFAAGEYAQARDMYAQLNGYQDSDNMILACYYQQGAAAKEAGELKAARDFFLQSGNYEDGQARYGECCYLLASAAYERNEYEEAIGHLDGINWGESANLVAKSWVQLGRVHQRNGKQQEAINAFAHALPLEDAVDAIYQYASDSATINEYEHAIEALWLLAEHDVERAQALLNDLAGLLALSAHDDLTMMIRLVLNQQEQADVDSFTNDRINALLARFTLTDGVDFESTMRYRWMNMLISKGRWKEAYLVSRTISTDDAVQTLIASHSQLTQYADWWAQYTVGKKVTFGKFTQENANTYTPVDWYVIGDLGDGKVMLLSEKLLDYKFYFGGWSRYNTSCSWQKSTLYRWCEDFYKNDRVFTPSERTAVVQHGEAGHVFALSLDEVKKYVVALNLPAATETAHTGQEKSGYGGFNGRGGWWLRAEYNASSVYYVNKDNKSYGSQSVGTEDYVRPALILDLYKLFDSEQ